MKRHSPVLIVTRSSEKVAQWMCIVKFTPVKSRSPVQTVTRSSQKVANWIYIVEVTQVKSPFVCPECDKIFTQKAKLITHRRSPHRWKAVVILKFYKIFTWAEYEGKDRLGPVLELSKGEVGVEQGFLSIRSIFFTKIVGLEGWGGGSTPNPPSIRTLTGPIVKICRLFIC